MRFGLPWSAALASPVMQARKPTWYVDADSVQDLALPSKNLLRIRHDVQPRGGVSQAWPSGSGRHVSSAIGIAGLDSFLPQLASIKSALPGPSILVLFHASNVMERASSRGKYLRRSRSACSGLCSLIFDRTDFSRWTSLPVAEQGPEGALKSKLVASCCCQPLMLS